MDPYLSKSSVVELEEQRYKNGELTSSYLSPGRVHHDQHQRHNYFDRSVPLLKQTLTLSGTGKQRELLLTSTIKKELDEVLEVTPEEGAILELLAKLGGCFYLLVQLWHHLIFKHISRQHYLLKMLKKIFYVKLDNKDKAIFGPGHPGPTGAAGRYEVVRPSDPFQHQDAKLEEMFEAGIPPPKAAAPAAG